jgi:hypothetical protein
MIRPGGPIIHFPQLFFFKFLEGDEVVLAFLVSKLSQANRAKKWAFLA